MTSQTWLVRPVSIFRSFELNFEALHANLEAIHGLDGGMSARWVVEAHESCSNDNTACYLRLDSPRYDVDAIHLFIFYGFDG